MRVAAILLAGLCVVQQAAGQTLGDSVRVEFGPDRFWFYGRLAEVDSDGMVLIRALERTRFERVNLGEVQLWKPGNAAAAIPLGAVLVGGTFALLWSEDTVRTSAGLEIQRKGWTSSRASEALLGAGLGILAGVIDNAIALGKWKRWEPWAP